MSVLRWVIALCGVALFVAGTLGAYGSARNTDARLWSAAVLLVGIAMAVGAVAWSWSARDVARRERRKG